MRHARALSVLALATAALLAAGCGGPDDSPAEATSPAADHDPATRLTVRLADIPDLRPVAGLYTSDAQSVARARVGGTLVRLLVDEGSVVTAGQLIGVVDEARMGAEITAREAAARAAGSVAGAGASGARAAMADLERARAMAAQAPAALERARAGLAVAEADWNRTRALAEQGVYAPARLERMEAARRAALADVASAQAGVAASRQAVAAAEAQAALAGAQARAAEAQSDAARAEAGIAVAMRAEGRILAPRSGRVTLAPVPQGSVVMPGEAVAVIAGGAPVLKLTVPETDAAQLRTGQALSLTDRDGRVTGQALVRAIYPAVANGVVEVDLTTDGVAPRFDGERTSVLVPAGVRRGIVVPPSLVQTRGGITFARLLRAGQAMDVPVQTGQARPDGVEVLSGLADGDVIVAFAAARSAPATEPRP